MPNSSASSIRPTNNAFDADVIIVGGGLAGYTALEELNQRGLSVILLEEKPRAGGNARTYVAPDGQLHPGGSTVLGVDGNGVLVGFLERLGLRPVAKNTINPGYVLSDDPAVGPGPHSFDLFKPGKSAVERTIAYELNDAVEQMRQDLEITHDKKPFPLREITSPAVLALDAMSLLDYLRKKGFPRHVVEFVDTIARSDTGAPAAANSALAGLMDFTLYINNGNDFWIYPGGNFSVIREVTKRVEGSVSAGRVSIRHDHQVTAIQEEADGAVVSYAKAGDGQPKTLRAQQVLLGAPPHRVLELVDLSSEAREQLGGVRQSGAYAIVSIYVDSAALATHKFYIFNQDPERRQIWTTDFVQTSHEGDHQTPIGSPFPSVITVYAPLPPSPQREVPTDDEIADKVIGEITAPGRLPDLRRHITGRLVTLYPEGIAYLAPGGARKIAALNPRVSPHIRLIHSSLGGGGIVSAARGALWEGLHGAEEAALAISR